MKSTTQLKSLLQILCESFSNRVGAARLASVALLVIISMLCIAWFVEDLYLGLVITVSLLPVTLLYGGLTMNEFNAVEKKYEGWRIFTWPLLIFMAGMGARIVLNAL